MLSALAAAARCRPLCGMLLRARGITCTSARLAATPAAPAKSAPAPQRRKAAFPFADKPATPAAHVQPQQKTVAEILQARLPWSESETLEYMQRRPWLCRVDPQHLDARISALLALASPARLAAALQTSAKILRPSTQETATDLGVLQNTLGMSTDELWLLLVRMPSVLDVPAADLAARALFLQQWYDGADVRRMALRHPWILLRTPHEVQTAAAVLAEELEMDAAGARRLICTQPQLVSTAGARDTLRLRMRTFEAVLQCSPAELRALLRRKPMMLSLSPARMTEAAETLSGLFGADRMHSVACRAPGLLEQSRETLQRKVAAFADILGGISLADAADVLASTPTIGQLRPDTLRAKAEFLARCGLQPSSRKVYVILLTLSLEGRLRPRVAFAAHKGVPFQSSYFSLRDDAFAKAVNAQPDDWLAFQKTFVAKHAADASAAAHATLSL